MQPKCDCLLLKAENAAFCGANRHHFPLQKFSGSDHAVRQERYHRGGQGKQEPSARILILIKDGLTGSYKILK